MTQFDKIEAGIDIHNEMIRDGISPDGKPLWETSSKQRRIAQAACNYAGYIVTGTRHFCPIMQMQIEGIGRDVLTTWLHKHYGNPSRAIQGFTDQYGNFLTRQEAYPIAKAAGQIFPSEDHSPGTLFSECYV